MKTALVLSGGGALGGFEAAVESYARTEKGYKWDVVAGVSVGALNGSMIAMDKQDKLWEIWNTVTSKRVYTGGFNLWSILKIAFGAKSFFGNKPLWKLIQSELDTQKVTKDLYIGTASLRSGEYISRRFAPPPAVAQDSEFFQKVVLASTVMPLVWTPVTITPSSGPEVDGGAINISPLSAVLDLDPDEVVIVNCFPDAYKAPKDFYRNILNLGMNALNIIEHGILQSNIKTFLMINDLVRQAMQAGITLLKKDSTPYKEFKCKIIAPDHDLGDILDFSQKAVQPRILHGFERAKAIFG